MECCRVDDTSPENTIVGLPLSSNAILVHCLNSTSCLISSIIWLTTHTHAALWLPKYCNQCVYLGAVGGGIWFRINEVESAAEVGLCCTHNAPGFPISQGNAEALCGKTKHHLISHYLRTTSAKSYRNGIVYVKIIASQRDVFETQCGWR